MKKLLLFLITLIPTILFSAASTNQTNNSQKDVRILDQQTENKIFDRYLQRKRLEKQRVENKIQDNHLEDLRVEQKIINRQIENRNWERRHQK